MWLAFKYQVRFVAVNLLCKDKIDLKQALTQLTLNVTGLKGARMQNFGEPQVGC